MPRASRRAAHGLLPPLFTVVSAVLGSGNGSDRHSLAAMRGWRRDGSTSCRGPCPAGLAAADAPAAPLAAAGALGAPSAAAAGCVFERVRQRPTAAYDGLLLRTGRRAIAEIARLMAHKRPSTGLVALALGLAEAGFAHAILAGFDFTLSHAYGHNPLIDQRGDALSKHADTDIAILARDPGAARLPVDERARGGTRAPASRSCRRLTADRAIRKNGRRCANAGAHRCSSTTARPSSATRRSRSGSPSR